MLLRRARQRPGAHETGPPERAEGELVGREAASQQILELAARRYRRRLLHHQANHAPAWRVAWMLGQEAPGGASAPRAARNGGESHERLRSRKLRHRDDRREDHQHGSAAAGVRTARAVNDELVCSGAPPRSGAERLEVDVDSDTRHLVSRAEPACCPVKRAAGPAAAAEKRSVSDSVGRKPSASQFWQLVYFCVE